MAAVFFVYISLLCYAARRDEDRSAGQEFPPSLKPEQEKGLSASDLEKIPESTGKDLILGTDCAICLDDITSEEAAKLIPGCNHGFHVLCIHMWLSKRSICPVCRAEIGSHLFNAHQNHADPPC